MSQRYMTEQHTGLHQQQALTEQRSATKMQTETIH